MNIGYVSQIWGMELSAYKSAKFINLRVKGNTECQIK